MSELLPISFRAVDEGSDPKSQPPGTMLVAENCAMDKGRRLIKRLGTKGLARALIGGGAIASGQRLITRGDDIAIFDGEKLYAYASALDAWRAIDRPPSLSVSVSPLVDSTRSVTSVDIAIYQGWLIIAYTVANVGASYVEVRDLATSALVYQSPLFTAGSFSNVRAIVSGTTACFISANDLGQVVCKKLDLTTLTLSAGTGLLLNTSRSGTASVFDAVIATPTAGVPTLYIAYELQAGVNRFAVSSWTLSTLAFIATATVLGTNVVSTSMCFCDLTQKLMVAFSAATTGIGTWLVSFNPALGATLGPDSIYAAPTGGVFVAENDAVNVLAGYQQDFGTVSVEGLTTALYSVATHVRVASSARQTLNVTRPSKPWRVAGRWFLRVITLAHGSVGSEPIPASSSVVVEVETADSLTGVQNATHPHVATLANQTGWYGALGTQSKAEVDAAGNVYIPAAHRNLEPEGYASSIPLGFDLYKLEAAPLDLARPAIIGNGALCAGGAPFWYDGFRAMPFGFACAPAIVSINAAAGGAMVAGTYSYVAVYEWRDVNGVLHRSTPSPPKTGVTAGGNLSLNVVVDTSSLSSKQRTLFGANAINPVQIVLYRTTIGGTGSHYRLTREPSYQVFINDPQNATVTCLDTKADANIALAPTETILLADQAPLYTDEGELADVPPPALSTVIVHRGRLVGIYPDRRTLGFSKDSTADATLAPGFDEALTLAFAHDKYALASLDEKLVVFGEDTIDLVFGDGPDDTGGQNTWQIQAVQTDVGCINPRSVVAGPPGSFFQSRRGIELLGRDLTLTRIGKAIEDTLALFPTITSAVLVASLHEIRFTCVAANGATGIVLAWDYHNGTWFTRKYKDSAASGAASIPFVDAALIGGVYTMLTAGGQVYQETALHKLDGGVDFVNRDVVLAPISPTDKMAWHRVKDVSLLGTSVTDHDLEVSIARDYATAYEQVKVFAARTDATTIGPLEKCRVSLKNQKSRAVKLRIRDLTPTAPGVVGNGDGPILEGLALRVARKDGLPKTTAAEQG